MSLRLNNYYGDCWANSCFSEFKANWNNTQKNQQELARNIRFGWDIQSVCSVTTASFLAIKTRNTAGSALTPFLIRSICLSVWSVVEKNDEHQTASLNAENFMRVSNREVVDIQGQLDDHHHRQLVQWNRAALKFIIKCLLFCAHQNIALRGHTTDIGNFRALIRLRADHEEVLRKHLQTVPKNAANLSPNI